MLSLLDWVDNLLCLCNLLNNYSKGEQADLVKVSLNAQLCKGQWHFHTTERAAFKIADAKGVNNYCKKRRKFRRSKWSEWKFPCFLFRNTTNGNSSICCGQDAHHSLTPRDNFVSINLMGMFLDGGMKLEGPRWQRPRRCRCTSCAVVSSGVFISPYCCVLLFSLMWTKHIGWKRSLEVVKQRETQTQTCFMKRGNLWLSPPPRGRFQ